MEIPMNKSNKVVIFLLMMGLVSASADAMTEDVVPEKIVFNQSKEEEFEEIYRYRQQLEKDKSATEMREYLLSLKPSITNADELISLPYLIKQSEKSDPLFCKQWQDLLETFQLLKHHMHVPEEVEILFYCCSPTNDRFQYMAVYDLLDRNVYIMPNFFSRSAASQLFILIHELVHALQHMRLGAVSAYYDLSFFAKEHEADMYASETITCPICMHEMENDYPRENKGDGYLTYADIVICRNNKKPENCCGIHNIDSIENERLRSLLAIPGEMFTPEQIQEYLGLTYVVGSLKERLLTCDFKPCNAVKQV
jgi:hypothetical protein